MAIIMIRRFDYFKGEKTTLEEVLNHPKIEVMYNWDLVDASADKILGAYLFHGDRSLLYELAESGDLWSQRIAMIATFHFIKQNDFKDALEIATLLNCTRKRPTLNNWRSRTKTLLYCTSSLFDSSSEQTL